MKHIVNKYHFLFRAFEQNGYELFIVGGAVRDHLLGKESKDIDFATDATPTQICDMFPKLINPLTNNSSQFGTVFLNWNDEGIEITTFRKDITRGRKPQTSFTKDIREDAKRRDFTINALYADKDGEIIDFSNGQVDLKTSILSCVGDTFGRLREDPLRILRAIRFIAKGFVPDIDLYYAMQNRYLLHLLNDISVERIRDEFLKCLAIDPRKTINLLKETGLIEMILPEWAITLGYHQETPYHKYDLDEHLIRTAEHLKENGADTILVLIGLLHDIGKPSCKSYKDNGNATFLHHEHVGSRMVVDIFEYLKMSNKEINRAHTLIKHHMRLHHSHSGYNLRKTAYLVQPHQEDLVKLYHADLWASAENVSDLERLPPIPDIPVNGIDCLTLLDELNIKEHKIIGTMLDYTRKWVFKQPDIEKDVIMGRLKGICLLQKSEH